MDKITEMLAALKARLKEREKEYHWVNSWSGDTEGGFYDEHEFDLDKLFNEIDAFGEELRASQGRIAGQEKKENDHG
jgi:hypothetical protein